MTADSPRLPLIFASVGTDHHRFDRLVSWMDQVATARPQVRVVVQHGTSRAPTVAEGYDYLSHEHLSTLVGSADMMICHGGPGTIMDARAAGLVPVCVPRDPARREHVDGHQIRFATFVARSGVVELTTGVDDLLERVDARLDGGRDLEHAIDHAVPAGVVTLGRELDRLIADAHHHRPRRRTSLWRTVSGSR